MARTRESADVDVRAIVHVAGPLEREPDESPLGYAWVQRCLRCDDLVAIWHVVTAPGNAFRVGRLLAVDPQRGIAGGREAVGEVGPRDRLCSPTPIAWL